MNGSDSTLRFATVVGLALVAVALIMNTCAMDRMETQVIRQTKAIESLASGGGSMRPPVKSSATTAVAAHEPGTGSGTEAVGWGGSRAEVLHVEGAVANAPLRASDKPHPQGDWYVNRRTSPPSTLNYYATSEGDTSQITQWILGRLMAVDPDAPPSVIPSLATRWEVADDKLTYTYHLRKGVQHADGRPFTAEDVLFSFAVMRDPTVKAEALRAGFEDVEAVSAPDPHTVVVKYRKTYWKGIYTVGFSLRVLNKGWYEEQIPLWAARHDIKTFSAEPGKPGFGEVFNMITIPCPGAGPYYFKGEEYQLGKPVELAPNPFYFGLQVMPTWHNFAGLRWVFISDEVAAAEAFRKKEFDVMVVEFQPYDEEWSKDPTITSISKYVEYDHIGLGYSFIAWNNRKPPFDDIRVRQAMTHLTDREWIVREINRGRGQVATGITKPSYPEYSHDIVPLAFDIEKARTLLAEAGWKDTDGDGVLDKDGKRFEFEMKAGSQRRFFVQIMAALQDACKKVGIRMTSRTLEWATFSEDLDERRFDAAILLVSHADPWHDPFETLHSSQDVPRGGNIAGWRNKRADELMEAMRVEFDDATRTAMFHEVNHLFDADQPMTLLEHSRVGVLTANRFEDVKVRPTGLQFFDWWVEPQNVLHR